MKIPTPNIPRYDNVTKQSWNDAKNDLPLHKDFIQLFYYYDACQFCFIPKKVIVRFRVIIYLYFIYIFNIQTLNVYLYT